MSNRVVVVVVAAETEAIVVGEVVEMGEEGKCKGVHTKTHSAGDFSRSSATIKLNRSVWAVQNVDYLAIDSRRFPQLHAMIYCVFTMWKRTVYSFHCNRKEALSSTRNVTMASLGNIQYRSNLLYIQMRLGSVVENSCQMNLGA